MVFTVAQGGNEKVPFKEGVAGIYLRQFLQKHIDIIGVLCYNRLNKSRLWEGIMNYHIRTLLEGEDGLLQEFLYNAIFVPEGVPAPPKSIINQPKLQVYIADFGKKKDDIGLVAEVDKRVVGAVWVRIMNDYGHIDNHTPSFAISLYKDYRGFGIGTNLMKKMLHILKDRGFKQASLAVQKTNYAVRMYQKTGFEIVGENEEEYIMLCRL